MCNLENEILKESKNDIFWSKNMIFQRFQPLSQYLFIACTTLLIRLLNWLKWETRIGWTKSISNSILSSQGDMQQLMLPSLFMWIELYKSWTDYLTESRKSCIKLKLILHHFCQELALRSVRYIQGGTLPNIPFLVTLFEQ